MEIRQQKRAILLRLISELKVHSPLKAGEPEVQRLVYVLQEMLNEPLGYKFELSKDKLCSHELSHDLKEMVEAGLLSYSYGTAPGSLYVITKATEKLVAVDCATEDKIKLIVRMFLSSGGDFLEKMSVVHYATVNSQYQREAERDLERDLELVKQATPGPWVMELFDHDVAVKTVDGQAIIYRPSGMRSIHIKSDDWVFVTEAREGWPYAIEEALLQRSMVKKLESSCRDLSSKLDAKTCQIDQLAEVAEDLIEVIEEVNQEIDDNISCRCGYDDDSLCRTCAVQNRAHLARRKAQRLLEAF